MENLLEKIKAALDEGKVVRVAKTDDDYIASTDDGTVIIAKSPTLFGEPGATIEAVSGGDDGAEVDPKLNADGDIVVNPPAENTDPKTDA